jgi:hypothetical protein
MSDNAILAAMRRMGIGKDELSGFRAVARTILVQYRTQQGRTRRYAFYPPKPEH